MGRAYTRAPEQLTLCLIGSDMSNIEQPPGLVASTLSSGAYMNAGDVFYEVLVWRPGQNEAFFLILVGMMVAAAIAFFI